MAQKKQYLVELGIPSIKKYVFATDRLKSIRGASALLAHLNHEEYLKDILSSDNLRIEFISAGGGAAQFVVTGTDLDIENQMNALSNDIARKTGNGLTIIYGKALYSQENYALARRLAIYESNRKRDETPVLSTSMVHTGYARECDDCSQIINKETTSPETELLCNVCQEKIHFNNTAKKGLWIEFSEFLQKTEGIRIKKSVDFTDIGKHCKSRHNYTAVVYADGNSMGKIIQQIKTPDEFEFFSDTIENAIKESCFEALYETYTDIYQHPLSSFPGEILMLGGDDLIVYLTADMAFPFALGVASRFQQKTKDAFDCNEGAFFKELTGGEGITISLGIAYGKVNTPISMLLNQAESLLQSAKTAGSKVQTNPHFVPTYIDFHISTLFNQVDISQCRQQYLQLSHAPKSDATEKPLYLYQKPYAIDDAQKLYNHAKQLSQVIPGTRLKRFGVAPTLGKVNGILETLKLYTNTPKGTPRQAVWDAFNAFDCIQNMPWKISDNEKSQSTMIVDLVELAGFIGN